MDVRVIRYDIHKVSNNALVYHIHVHVYPGQLGIYIPIQCKASTLASGQAGNHEAFDIKIFCNDDDDDI